MLAIVNLLLLGIGILRFAFTGNIHVGVRSLRHLRVVIWTLLCSHIGNTGSYFSLACDLDRLVVAGFIEAIFIAVYVLPWDLLSGSS